MVLSAYFRFKSMLPVRSLSARSLPKGLAVPFRQTIPDLQSGEESVVRLIAAYKAATAAEAETNINVPGRGGDLWDHILQNDMANFCAALEEGDTAAIFSYLKGIGSRYVWFGGLTLGIDGYTPQRWSQEQVAALYFEKLVALAEAVGALNLESPESGPWQENIRLKPDAVISALESHLGIDITPPDDILATFGVVARDRVYHYRHINALYAAQLIACHAPAGGRVAEIGGGLGLAALYARRFKSMEYTIYDLPISNLVAGFFLIQALGPDQVCLFGEEPAAQGGVRLQPYWMLADVEDKSLDVVLNQDALPEIDDDIIGFLLSHITRGLRGDFLSINHETFGARRVADFIAKHTDMRRMSRARNWVREGYVDERFIPGWADVSMVRNAKE